MKYDDLLEITSCFNSTTGEVDRKYIEEVVDRIIATCAAGPWQEGEPPKDGQRRWLGLYPYSGIEVIVWNSIKKHWMDQNDLYAGPPDKHAPINLP